MIKGERSLIKKLEEIDRRVLFWILAIIMIIMIARPIGLPVLVSDRTRSYWNVLEEVKSGDVVFIHLGIGFVSEPELGPSFKVTVNELMEKGVKIIFFGSADVEPVIYEMLVPSIMDRYPDKEYGVNYVNLGYVPGGETGIKALADNIPGTVVTDTYGTNVNEIPVMQGIKDAFDVDLLITFEGGAYTIYHIRHWHMPYDTPIIASGTGAIISDLLPYLDAGTLKGLSGGLRGGAELELLARNPGPALSRMDAISSSHFYLLILIIICNILYLLGRTQR